MIPAMVMSGIALGMIFGVMYLQPATRTNKIIVVVDAVLIIGLIWYAIGFLHTIHR
jgi:hypothetical protein